VDGPVHGHGQIQGQGHPLERTRYEAIQSVLVMVRVKVKVNVNVKVKWIVMVMVKDNVKVMVTDMVTAWKG